MAEDWESLKALMEADGAERKRSPMTIGALGMGMENEMIEGRIDDRAV